MRKIVSLGFLFILVQLTIQAQKEGIDVKISSHSFIIYHINPDAIKAISSMPNKQDNKVVIGKMISQSEFDRICGELGWIRELEIARHNEQIKNISAISNLKSLQRLKINASKASKESPIDLGPLQNLSLLSTLDFYGTHVTNTEALGSLNKLQNISFYKSAINSISFLENTPEIRQLSFYGFEHTFEDYQPVANLKELKSLNIYMNEQAIDQKLVFLKSLSNLRQIKMSDNPNLTSLDFLENNSNMEEIHASWCTGLNDFSALTNMKKLKILFLRSTQLENLDMLMGITTLTNIDISKTRIKNISFLKNCSNLSSIKISKTQIKDISPLFNCKKLKRIELSSNVPGEQIERLKSLNPKIRIRVLD